MDRVPRAFRERVAALWKCCENGSDYRYLCLHGNASKCAWMLKSKKQRLDFYIGRHNGTWKYCFRDCLLNGDDEYLTMAQLVNYPNLKHVTLKSIRFSQSDQMKALDEDIEKLVKFVAYLSDEPCLDCESAKIDDFNTPEGVTLLKYLSKVHFCKTTFKDYFPVYDRLLENQFSRRKPTMISLKSCEMKGFLVEHLNNGNIKQLDGPTVAFPVEVMESIISNFLENPGNYERSNFTIVVDFDDPIKIQSLLDQLLEEERCRVLDDGYQEYYLLNVADVNQKRTLIITKDGRGSSALQFEMGLRNFCTLNEWDQFEKEDYAWYNW